MREVIGPEIALSRPERPARSSKPPGTILRLKGGESIEAVCLSKTFVGFTIHFDERDHRSMPCTLANGKCLGHEEELPIKDKWYLHVATREPGPIWLEFTDGANIAFCDQLGKDEEFRGVKFTMRRTAKNNGRLVVVVDPYFTTDHSKMHLEQSPENLLRWLWNQESRRRKP